MARKYTSREDEPVSSQDQKEEDEDKDSKLGVSELRGQYFSHFDGKYENGTKI